MDALADFQVLELESFFAPSHDSDALHTGLS